MRNAPRVFDTKLVVLHTTFSLFGKSLVHALESMWRFAGRKFYANSFENRTYFDI